MHNELDWARKNLEKAHGQIVEEHDNCLSVERDFIVRARWGGGGGMEGRHRDEEKGVRQRARYLYGLKPDRAVIVLPLSLVD